MTDAAYYVFYVTCYEVRLSITSKTAARPQSWCLSYSAVSAYVCQDPVTVNAYCTASGTSLLVLRNQNVLSFFF